MLSVSISILYMIYLGTWLIPGHCIVYKFFLVILFMMLYDLNHVRVRIV